VINSDQLWPFIERGYAVTDLRHEPAFNLLGEVTFSGDSDLVCHLVSQRCLHEAPHDISICGEFD
jgi:hypothetical protein